MVMGTEVFKAASGREVKPGEDGSVLFGKGIGYLSREAAFDAEEYFQHRRDVELGRWRSRLNPGYVVYPREDYIRVFDEAESTIDTYWRDDRSLPRNASGDVTGEYFASHPEHQPWHDAQAGQFWAVQHMGMQEVCRVDDVDGVLRFVGVDGKGSSVSMPITHHSIVRAARLVVSEMSSQAGLASFRGAARGPQGRAS